MSHEEEGSPIAGPSGLLQGCTEQTFRVPLGDVDAARIHFSSVFDYADRANAELFHQLGLPLTAMLRCGFGLPVVQANSSYVRSFGLDDVIRVTSRVAEVRDRSITVDHRITRLQDGAELANVTIVHVCVDEDGRPAPIARLFEALALVDG
ncbi:MAG: acyl-CoA thioesterase [Actinomycetota bacterium]